ncbi:uncharacterized protein IAS62_004161 [Cryptococcus decagattii]|uniref:Uncharacterized protein n=1 Tax=Cryptococcus decagattii TaxID=1859122 RepID=A0ABZ2B016_9TREE
MSLRRATTATTRCWGNKTQVDGLLAGTFSDVDLNMGESLRVPTFRHIFKLLRQGQFLSSLAQYNEVQAMHLNQYAT